MALHSDFKGLRSSILQRPPLASVDVVVIELLVEQIRFKSHFEKEIISTPNYFMFVAPFKPPSNNKERTYRRVADGCSFC